MAQLPPNSLDAGAEAVTRARNCAISASGTLGTSRGNFNPSVWAEFATRAMALILGTILSATRGASKTFRSSRRCVRSMGAS